MFFFVVGLLDDFYPVLVLFRHQSQKNSKTPSLEAETQILSFFFRHWLTPFSFFFFGGGNLKKKHFWSDTGISKGRDHGRS